ncbi:hypothetical protein [Cellulomonas hominis]
MGFPHRRPDHTTEPDRVRVEPGADGGLSGPAHALLTTWRGCLDELAVDTADVREVAAAHDYYLTQWLTTPLASRPDPSRLVAAFGAAVGDELCRRVDGARWSRPSGQGSAPTDTLAVTHGPVTVSPARAVAQQWAQGRPGDLLTLITTLERELTTAVAIPVPTPRPSAAPRTAPTAPSRELQDLALCALAHALESVVPDGGPLVPFALVENPSGRALARFAGASAQEIARRQVRARADARRAAIAWAGRLTRDGVPQEAVFVEAGDRGSGSVILAHLYRDVPGNAEAVGSPVLVGHGDGLL